MEKTLDEVIDTTHPIYEHWKEVQDKLFETKKKRPRKYYLHPAKARSWMEGLLARAGQIVSKSGPAFTSKYKVKADGTFIDVDIVPVFHIGTCEEHKTSFPGRTWKVIKRVPEWKSKCFGLVPKPAPAGADIQARREWRFDFRKLEKKTFGPKGKEK